MASASDIYVKLQKLSNQATKTTLKYNKEEATTARDWQKSMSDTSHQREVKDLIKAGLNPVLSAGGNGAQSYTTQAASGQAENAAGAVAAAYGADQSAAATRYAANQSAAATRAAAAANVRAAQIAAAANMYASDTQYKINKERNETNLKLLDKTPPNNVPQLLWKIFDQAGIRGAAVENNTIQFVSKQMKRLLDNPIAYFKGTKDGVLSMKDYALNSNGFAVAKSSLKSLGINPSYANAKILINAVVFHKIPYMNMLANLIPKKHSAANYKGKYFYY